MKGLEVAQKYYETYGRNMLKEQFSQILNQTAAGLVGYAPEGAGRI